MTLLLFISCDDTLVLYGVVCLINDDVCVWGVSIVIDVADMVFYELHLISGGDARTLLLGCL